MTTTTPTHPLIKALRRQLSKRTPENDALVQGTLPTHRLVIMEEALAKDADKSTIWWLVLDLPFAPYNGMNVWAGDVNHTVQSVSWHSGEGFFMDFGEFTESTFDTQAGMEAHYRSLGFIPESEYSAPERPGDAPQPKGEEELDWAYIADSIGAPSEFVELQRMVWAFFDHAERAEKPSSRESLLLVGADAFRHSIRLMMQGHAEIMAEIAADDARNGVAA